MQLSNIRNLRAGFEFLLSSQSVQAAMMVLQPGETSDEELGNEHPRAEQWVYIVAGNGSVRVAAKGKNVRTKRIRSGDIVLIKKGERHQFKNTGRKPLRTLNLYSPPAYTANGDVKPKAKGRWSAFGPAWSNLFQLDPHSSLRIRAREISDSPIAK